MTTETHTSVTTEDSALTPGPDAAGSERAPQDHPSANAEIARPSEELAASDAAAEQSAGVEAQVYATESSAPQGAHARAEDQSDASETGEPRPEKARRRVQLRPTYSPDIARPVPTLPGQSSSPETGPRSSQDAVPAAVAEGPASAGSAATAGHPPEADADAEETAAGSASEAHEPLETHYAAGPRPEPVALPPREEPLDADIEAQLDAALTSGTEVVAGPDDAELSAEALQPVADEEIGQGARVSGTVQSIHGDDMFIDLGVRMAGVLSRRQFGLRRQPMQGEAITVIVNRIDEKEGLIHVNLPTGATRVRGNWEELSVDQTVECIVNGVNKGGLEVSVGSLRGFMPASQVELGFVADLNTYVGQKFRAQITEINPKRRKLVLSRRKLLEVERSQTEQDFFQKVAPGQTYTGRVKTIKDYGAFIDIGGVDGLLHVGQMSWGRINHPKELLTEGQEIEVKVLSVDPEKKKIGLGMRQLSQNPWKAAEDRFTAGTVTRGKVNRIEKFGAFIELEPGIEGLVHISELDHQRIRSVQEVLKVGQEVDVQVLECDPSRKRISLSVKALKEKPEDAPPPETPAFTPVRRQSPESLKGGIGEPTGGKLFGDPGRFRR